MLSLLLVIEMGMEYLNIYIIGGVLAYLIGSIPCGLIVGKMAGIGDIRTVGSGNIGATNMVRAGGKKLGALTLLLDALKGIVVVSLAAHFLHTSIIMDIGSASDPRSGWGLGVSPPSSSDIISASDPRSGWGLGVSPPSSSDIINASDPRSGWGLKVSPPSILYIYGLIAVIGHCFPIWLKFNGGKGVATTLGIIGAVHIAVDPASWWWLLGFAALWIGTFKVTRMVSFASLITFAVLPPFAYALYGIWLSPLLLTTLIFIRHRTNIVRLIHGTEHGFSKNAGKK